MKFNEERRKEKAVKRKGMRVRRSEIISSFDGWGDEVDVREPRITERLGKETGSEWKDPWKSLWKENNRCRRKFDW